MQASVNPILLGALGATPPAPPPKTRPTHELHMGIRRFRFFSHRIAYCVWRLRLVVHYPNMYDNSATQPRSNTGVGVETRVVPTVHSNVYLAYLYTHARMTGGFAVEEQGFGLQDSVVSYNTNCLLKPKMRCRHVTDMRTHTH